MAIGVRQVRGIGVIAAALVVLAAFSFAYLRPAPSRPATPVPHVTQGVDGSVRYSFTVTGQTDGGFFTWRRNAGSGGHAT